MIQFLLNQTLQTLVDVDPNTTVLNWLRTTARRSGTKEGCASGDCGACTVVLAQPDAAGQRLRYETANSCIMLVSQLQGKQLLTVEDLAHQGRLHQVQQAMADCHASQCGFCTPGFVMSTFALHKSGEAATHQNVEQHLAGNLCRCTGYRPIIDAARQACATPEEDSFTCAEQHTLACLRELQHGAPLTLTGGDDHRCLVPASLPQLAQLYVRHPDARLLAGGTDLALAITQQYQALPLLIALHQIPELRLIEIDAQAIRLGAAASLHRCQQMLATLIPAFSQVLSRFASRQVRNQGTLGGNLANASPIGDTAPMLLALDAHLQLRCGDQTRLLALDDFFTGYRQTALAPGEFIECIIIPRVTVSPLFAAWKVSKRRDDDISTVFGAFNLMADEGVCAMARIAFGGMAATPARARACEQALVGQPLTDATLDGACATLAQDFQPLSDFRGSGAYRLAVAQNLLRRWFMQHVHCQTVVEVQDYVN